MFIHLAILELASIRYSSFGDLIFLLLSPILLRDSSSESISLITEVLVFFADDGILRLANAGLVFFTALDPTFFSSAGVIDLLVE